MKRDPPPPAAATADGRRHRGALKWIVWLGVLVALTALLITLRGRLDKAHIALVLLLFVLSGSATGGRTLGLTLVALSFLIFDFFFLLPYYTLALADPWDWLVLAAFLVTSVVATHLLDRAEERADAAHKRTVEVEHLAALGAETLNAGRAEDALSGIVEVIRSAIGVSGCEILVARGTPARFEPLAAAGELGQVVASGGGSLAEWVALHNAPAAVHGDGTTWVGAASNGGVLPTWHTAGGDVRELYLPLAVRERSVGVLRIAHSQSIELKPDQRQFLGALSYYAALGIERWRLVAEAQRAEALQQADALKTALIATVSHDLRTPLTTIKALAHALAERGQPGARSIEEEADRLNGFVGDLLDLSRLSSGALPLRLEINSASDVIGAAVQRVAGARDGRAIVVTGDEGDQPLFGRFDFVQTLRALGNLLENAFKYSPAGEPVEISAAQHGDELVFSVADRGPGVPTAERGRIFEPFYRAPGVPPDVGGAGLGLAIARGIAAEHDGDLSYDERSGGGSVFRLTVPAVSV